VIEEICSVISNATKENPRGKEANHKNRNIWNAHNKELNQFQIKIKAM
jgi:hypothetical protein